MKAAVFRDAAIVVDDITPPVPAADLPDPAVRIERVLDTIDRSMPGGHAIVAIAGLRVLADNLIDLQQSALMIDWCASVLDAREPGGEQGGAESSMTKLAVSEALMRVADRCVQVMGGSGVTGDTIVEQVFREIRAFRIHDGPSEVHRWSLAKKIKRDWQASR